MATTKFLAVNFGTNHTGASPGYTLYNADGTPNGSEVITGITEVGATGVYHTSVLATIPTNFAGTVVWSSKEATPVYASEDIKADYTPMVDPGMPYQVLFSAEFKSGLSTVGYQLKNVDGSNNGVRVTTGITEIGSGIYSALVPLLETFQGGILFDSGEATVTYRYTAINQGDASRAVGVGAGSSVLVVTVSEPGGSPVIPSCDVRIRNSAGNTLIAKNTTDVNGQARFLLSDATYKVYKYANVYTFTNPETTVVSGDTAASYVGTVVSITTPTAANTCRLFVWARTPDSSLKTSLIGSVKIIDRPLKYVNAAYGGEDISFTLHADGYWYVDVIYTAKIKVLIPTLGIDTVVIVPSLTTQDLLLLI